MGPGTIEETVDDPGQPLKAFLVALAIDLVFIPTVIVAIYIWPIFLLAIVPYIGGRLGGRYVDRSKAARIGGLAALISTTLLIWLLLSALKGIQPVNFDLFEPVGFGLIVLGYLISFIFGAIGGRHGATASVEK